MLRRNKSGKKREEEKGGKKLYVSRAMERCKSCTARKGWKEREEDRWKTLISKLYAVLIRISAETVQAQLPPEIWLYFSSGDDLFARLAKTSRDGEH